MAEPVETFLDFHFPKAGLDVAGPFGRQPTRQDKNGVYVRTAATGQNLRCFEAATGRDRGGSRPGLTKLISTQVNGTWIVQELSIVSTTNSSIAAVQQSNSGRVVYLLAVSNGVLKVAQPDDTAWTAVTNNSATTPALNDNGTMMSAPNNQKQYFVDGIHYRYYNPPTNSIETWTASNGGTLPVDASSNTARLICTWRGRTVLSGVLKDPQNIFMSKVGDPLDFDYAPDQADLATAAVALNLSDLGYIGDVVTALIPYNDDLLIVGGDSSIYVVRGDPTSGGEVDRISDVTGIAFGQAWCKDPYGNVYFFGSKPGIWMMQGGAGIPRRISQPIEPRLEDLDTGALIIRLIWDDRLQTVNVYLTESAAPAATTHFIWDYRANAWWPDVFANTNHNPLCCVAYDGNDADDRVVLLGCWDGYVRALDPDATTDDGTNIASSVLIGPILTQELDEMLLKDIQFVLAEASGTVTWEILAADTAEAAISASARASGTAGAGRNPTQPIRVADHAIYIKISATTRWAMEAIRAKFAGRGKVRRRKP